MKNDATQNILDAAAELNIPNEHLCNFRVHGGTALTFATKAGAMYDAKLTKSGKLKKGSVRLS